MHALTYLETKAAAEERLRQARASAPEQPQIALPEQGAVVLASLTTNREGLPSFELYDGRGGFHGNTVNLSPISAVALAEWLLQTFAPPGYRSLSESQQASVDSWRQGAAERQAADSSFGATPSVVLHLCAMIDQLQGKA